ncbi:hypothetical protein [Vibrio harveyi]|uniref:hypothetical protein n=1 Tax=Vibrio harveyi TaxID=669 RepID=UPI00165D8206|nr:hypothetical protein [Vibrio harveyi]
MKYFNGYLGKSDTGDLELPKEMPSVPSFGSKAAAQYITALVARLANVEHVLAQITKENKGFERINPNRQISLHTHLTPAYIAQNEAAKQAKAERERNLNAATSVYQAMSTERGWCLDKAKWDTTVHDLFVEFGGNSSESATQFKAELEWKDPHSENTDDLFNEIASLKERIKNVNRDYSSQSDAQLNTITADLKANLKRREEVYVAVLTARLANEAMK